MVGMYEEEVLPSRVRLEVIEPIRMVNENPFIFESDISSLSAAFEDFALGVQIAKMNLQKLTGVTASGSALKVEDVVKGTIAILKEADGTGRPVELVLAKDFMKCAKAPYFALLDLDKMAKQNKPLNTDLAKTAMEGLEALQLFANVVPSVFKTIKQEHAPSMGSAA